MTRMTILVVPVCALGHVNACIGATTLLLKRGHRVVHFVEESFRNSLEAKGLETYHFRLDSQFTEDANPSKVFSSNLIDFKLVGPGTPEEKFVNANNLFVESELARNFIFGSNASLKKAIDEIKPDCFVVDSTYLLPAIYYSGKPWVKIISFAPLIHIKHDDLPPGFFGLSEHSDKQTWEKYRLLNQRFFFSRGYSQKCIDMGYEPYPENILMPKTQILTVYGYPEELNYSQADKNWHNLEVFNRNETKETVDLKVLVPEDFLDSTLNGEYSGKLIYISMGSLGSIDVDLLKRIITALAKTKHKYIISKGPRGSECELAPNMYGEDFLPQLQIVPLVDLVITHGGNNTVTETLAQGKPLIVMPLFADQFDNAQRVQEKNLGIRIEPYYFDEKELIEAIDKLLNDHEMYERLRKMSNRIRNSTRHEELCDKLEQLIL